MNFKNPNTDILREKKLYIFDMDGTIYLGGQPFDFAIRFIKNLRKNGKQVLFYTNNASHTSPFYLQKLTRLGYEHLGLSYPEDTRSAPQLNLEEE